KNPWGNSSDASFVTVWDCSQPQPLRLWDIPEPAVAGNTQTANVTNVSAPRSSPGTSTSGSAAGTVNSVAAGFAQCNPSSAPMTGLFTTSSESLANEPYSEECDVAQLTLRQPPTDLLQPYHI